MIDHAIGLRARSSKASRIRDPGSDSLDLQAPRDVTIVASTTEIRSRQHVYATDQGMRVHPEGEKEAGSRCLVWYSGERRCST
jgi:hypothetical protein